MSEPNMRLAGSGKRVLTSSEEYGIAVYYVCGVSIVSICETFDISRSGVHRALLRLGIDRDRGKRTPKNNRQEVPA